jgi:hypothetical protein
MHSPRTARIVELAEQLTALAPLEPRAVRLARRAHDMARRDLAACEDRGDAPGIVDAMRYRVQRTADLIEQRRAQTVTG